MDPAESLTFLTGSDLSTVLGASMSIVVVMRSPSRRCAAYQSDIERIMANGEIGGIPVEGVLIDDAGALGRLIDLTFGKDLPAPPVTIVYRGGRDVEHFLTTRASYLTRRIAGTIARLHCIPSLEGPAGGVSYYGGDRTRS